MNKFSRRALAVYNKKGLSLILMIKYLLLIPFLLSCSDPTTDFNTDQLKEYYRPNSIRISTEGRQIKFEIVDSKTVQERRIKLSDKWSGPEALASVGAVIAFKENLAQLVDYNVINMTLTSKGKSETITYSYALLKYVNEALPIAEQFLSAINKRDSMAARNLLSDTILANYPSADLFHTLYQNILTDSIARTNFQAFQSDGEKVTLYINVYYYPSIAQTYLITFLKGSLRIVGVNIPHK